MYLLKNFKFNQIIRSKVVNKNKYANKYQIKNNKTKIRLTLEKKSKSKGLKNYISQNDIHINPQKSKSLIYFFINLSDMKTSSKYNKEYFLIKEIN